MASNAFVVFHRMTRKISSLEFFSREWKDDKHPLCVRIWTGLGLEICCYCNKNKFALVQVEDPILRLPVVTVIRRDSLNDH